MIHLCPETKKSLKITQVNDLFTLLACNRRHLPAFGKIGGTLIESDRSALIKVNGALRTPMAVAEAYHSKVFDRVSVNMDWENPLIVSITSIKKTEEGFVALNDEDDLVTLLPLSGIQQLYTADPNRFA